MVARTAPLSKPSRGVLILGKMDPNPHDRRRRARVSTMILCEIWVGEQPPELVRIRDLAEGGIRIATKKALLLGDRVVVLGRAGEAVRATVDVPHPRDPDRRGDDATRRLRRTILDALEK